MDGASGQKKPIFDRANKQAVVLIWAKRITFVTQQLP